MVKYMKARKIVESACKMKDRVDTKTSASYEPIRTRLLIIIVLQFVIIHDSLREQFVTK